MRRSGVFVLALAIGLASRSFAQQSGGMRNVSTDLFPSLYFKPIASEPGWFQKLPYETVELMILDTSEASQLGFISDEYLKVASEMLGESGNPKNYLVIVESWQRFDVRKAEGVSAYIRAVETNGNIDVSSLQTYSEANGNTEAIVTRLIKVGVSFRTIFVLEKEFQNGQPIPLSDYFSGNRRILARIEIVGASSGETSRSLPGVLELLSGSAGLSTFLTKTTTSRQGIWDALSRGTDSPLPNPQILGWAFSKDSIQGASPKPKAKSG